MKPMPIFFLLALFSVAHVSAQSAKPPTTDVASDPRLKQFDKNGDGKIDDSERAAIRELMRKRGQKTGEIGRAHV